MSDYEKLEDGEAYETWSGADICLPDSNDNDAIICAQNLSITDILGPDPSVPDVNIQFDNLCQTARQLSLYLHKKNVPKPIEKAWTITYYLCAREYMKTRFPDGSSFDDIFPGVKEQYAELGLTTGQERDVERDYYAARTVTATRVHKLLRDCK